MSGKSATTTVIALRLDNVLLDAIKLKIGDRKVSDYVREIVRAHESELERVSNQKPLVSPISSPVVVSVFDNAVASE